MNYICAKSFENLYSSYNKLTRYEYTDGVNYLKIADCCKVYNSDGVDVTYVFDLQRNCKVKFLIQLFGAYVYLCRDGVAENRRQDCTSQGA